MAKRNQASSHQVAVIGLGRFGSALAIELVDTGHDVLGIDFSEELVQRYSEDITQTIQADSTSRQALNEVNIQNFERVMVSIGTNIEASILTCSLLLEMGIREIWAKADTDAHGRILKQLGVHHVVFPESDMGRRIAHQVGGDQLDYVEIDQGFVMAKTAVASSFEGKSLTQLGLRGKYGVLVVATSHGDSAYAAATPDTIISKSDWMILAGPKDAVDRFCQIR